MSFFTQKVWEGAAIALLVALIGMGVMLGLTHIKLASTEVALAHCNQANAELKASIEVVNAKIEQGAAAKVAAEKRGDAARAAADENGKSLRQLLTKLNSAPKVKLVSCNDAMPTVNSILKEVK